MSEEALKIIQITDTHLFADSKKSLLGVTTQDSLEAILEHINQHAQRFDMLIHTGDVAQDYSEPAYRRIAAMLTRFNVPVYCVPGNHDDSKIMATFYPQDLHSNDRHIMTKHWQLILLNSQKPGAVEGELKKSELDFLQKCLHDHPKHHAIAMFHHHPVPVGSRWLDRLAITNADELWKITKQYPKLKAIFFGHVHQQYEEVIHGIACYSTPSTCFQFKRNQTSFGLEELPQGYRQIELYPDGRIETEVVRLEKYVGHFDTHAQGY